MNTITNNTADEKKMVKPGDNTALVFIQELRVWFELCRFGFGHAGRVRAVDVWTG